MLIACLTAACDGPDAGSTTAFDDGCATAGAGEAGAVAPIAVDCSFYFAGVQVDVSYEPSGEGIDTPVGGKLIAGGMLSDDENDGRSFSIGIHADDGSVLSHTLYQMDRSMLPRNEFYGDHGFTGLHAVKDPDAGESVQFACFARDPDDPVHRWEH